MLKVTDMTLDVQQGQADQYWPQQNGNLTDDFQTRNILEVIEKIIELEMQ